MKKNINCKNYKKAFTFVELIISIIISSIVFVLLTGIISKVFGEIYNSRNKTKIVAQIYDFRDKISEIKENFSSGSILIDNQSGTGSDVLLLESINTIKGGYIIGQVSNELLKIDGDLNVNIYGDKVLAIRKISTLELTELKTNPNNIYNYLFNKDEIFEKIKIKDFQLELYNTGSIFESSILINTFYNKKLDGEKFSEIGNDKIEKIILNF